MKKTDIQTQNFINKIKKKMYKENKNKIMKQKNEKLNNKRKKSNQKTNNDNLVDLLNVKPVLLWVTTGMESRSPGSADSCDVEFIDNWKGTGRVESNRKKIEK